MGKRGKSTKRAATIAGGRGKGWLSLILILGAVVVGGAMLFISSRNRPNEGSKSGPSQKDTGSASVPAREVTNPITQGPASAAVGGEISRIEVKQAVMVTVELDFGGKVPSIAEALTQIERVHQPEDGTGRSFAILDAYGGPTSDNKLHLSMHVSTEKVGLGSLVFRPTGKELWKSRIVPAADGTKAAHRVWSFWWTMGAVERPRSTDPAIRRRYSRPL
jgi:hypothetical protein